LQADDFQHRNWPIARIPNQAGGHPEATARQEIRSIDINSAERISPPINISQPFLCADDRTEIEIHLGRPSQREQAGETQT
jgi:hypothetical protein